MKQLHDTKRLNILGSARDSLTAFYYRKKLFTWLVLVPIFMCAFYIFALSANRWESVAKVTIKSAGSSDVSGIGLGFLVGANPTVREDAMFLREFIESYDMLDALDKSIGLRSLYAGRPSDPLSSLSKSSTKEEFLDYFRSRVGVVLDESSGVLTITAQGFSPESALKINREILSRSEVFLNDISRKMARDQAAHLQAQLSLTMESLNSAKAAVLKFQAKTKYLDPLKSSEAGAKLIGELTAQLSSSEAELGSMLSYMQEKAPQVVALRQKISALRAQVAKESSVVAGSSPGRSLNALASEFDSVRLQAELAHEIYKANLLQLERNKMDEVRKFKNLVVISSPHLPEESTVPNRPYLFLLWSLVILAIYFVGHMVWQSIEEHRS